MDALELVIASRRTWRHRVVLVPNAMELRFESNMSAVRLPSTLSLSLSVLTRLLFFTCTRATETASALQQAPERPQNQAAVRPQDRLRAPPPHRQLLRARVRPRQIRVTRNEKTGEVRECKRKVRLGDLNIYCPKRLVDWRVSVNVEIPGTSVRLCGVCGVYTCVVRACSAVNSNVVAGSECSRQQTLQEDRSSMRAYLPQPTLFI